MIDVLAVVAMFVGVVFFFGATLGVLRFPDFYSRVHAAGKGDTLSSVMILGGLGLLVLKGGHLGDFLVFIKIMLICAFIFITSPTTTHALTDAGYSGGVKPWQNDDKSQGDKE